MQGKKLRMILIIIGFLILNVIIIIVLILNVIINMASYARKHSEECHVCGCVLWEVYEVKGFLMLGVLVRYR